MTRRHLMLKTLAVFVVLTLSGSVIHAKDESSFAEAPSRLAAQLFEKLRAKPVGDLAVFPFPDAYDRHLGLSNWLANDLTASLASVGGLNVIERDRVDTILQENDFSASGLVDSTSAARMGELVGADTVLVGAWVEESSVVAVTARAVSVEKGTVLASAGVRIALETVPPDLLSPALGFRSPGESTPLDDGHVWRFGAFEVAVTSIVRARDRRRVTVSMDLRNQTISELPIGIGKGNFGRCAASLTDNLGHSILALGDHRGVTMSCVTKTASRGDYTHLPAFSMTPITMTFKANEGEEVNGTMFQLSIPFVFHTDDGRKETLAGFKGLALSDAAQ